MSSPGVNTAELPAPPQGREGWPWRAESLPAVPEGNWPLISVVTPAYNSGRYLEQALRSVFLQGYPRVEYILIDGGSDDDSLQIIKRYQSWLSHWVSEPDRGQSHAINKGLAQASGRLVLWLNADDFCLPGAFFKAAAAWSESGGAAVVCGGTAYVDAEGVEVKREPAHFTSWRDYLFRRCMIRQVSTFFDREALAALGGVDEGLQYCMDRDLLIRASKDRPPLVLDDYLCAYRIHGQAKTRRADTMLQRISESDRNSQAHLAGTPWLAEFKRDRAFAWLGFSGREGLSGGERRRCLVRALALRPMIAAYPDFWRAALASRGAA